MSEIRGWFTFGCAIILLIWAVGGYKDRIDALGAIRLEQDAKIVAAQKLADSNKNEIALLKGKTATSKEDHDTLIRVDAAVGQIKEGIAAIEKRLDSGVPAMH